MKKLAILLLLFISINEIQAQWANITFHTFECIRTDDFDETDEIIMEINGKEYDLGTFKIGQLKTLSNIIGTLQFKNSIKVQVIEMDGIGFINGHDYKDPFYPNYDDASAKGAITHTISQAGALYKITYTVTTN